MNNSITRSEYDELMRRVTNGEIAHVTMEADIMRMDKEILLVTHSIKASVC